MGAGGAAGGRGAGGALLCIGLRMCSLFSINQGGAPGLGRRRGAAPCPPEGPDRVLSLRGLIYTHTHTPLTPLPPCHVITSSVPSASFSYRAPGTATWVQLVCNLGATYVQLGCNLARAPTLSPRFVLTFSRGRSRRPQVPSAWLEARAVFFPTTVLRLPSQVQRLSGEPCSYFQLWV